MFYVLVGVALFRSYLFSVIALSFILFLYFRTKRYKKNEYEAYLNSFIDTLNQLNSGLSSGLTFESSVRNADPNIESAQYMNATIQSLQKALDMGITSDQLYEMLYRKYPIPECRLYVDMLILSGKTGASMNRVTETALENLYTKFKAVNEAKLAVYQKKLEHTILCVAPLFVILFVQNISGEFLNVLYKSTNGYLVILIAFVLLLTMKIVGKKIVEGIHV